MGDAVSVRRRNGESAAGPANRIGRLAVRRPDEDSRPAGRHDAVELPRAATIPVLSGRIEIKWTSAIESDTCRSGSREIILETNIRQPLALLGGLDSASRGPPPTTGNDVLAIADRTGRLQELLERVGQPEISRVHRNERITQVERLAHEFAARATG